MADRPILFQPAMVKALIAGTKTQTRRLLKPQPQVFETEPGRLCDVGVFHDDKDGRQRARVTTGRIITLQKIPYAIGDRLWVREAWRADEAVDECKPSELNSAVPIRYEADGQLRDMLGVHFKPGRRRASMHMPRWASRLTLIVTDVRVQRLQDISEADAIAEGIERQRMTVEGGTDIWYRGFTYEPWTPFPWLAYRQLWNRINGDGAWDANPYVVAYTFRVEQRNIDR